ncbi:kinesin-like protein KIN12B [Cucumis melo var. makuwa]|uniref:Kinesin-like protein KIN12B n=1 Tax=Cucumis melo var. makuwa TaxID=1194695 RepID=A0A5D3CU25_CUCMM|nr:kinesin-like protein KIN12B [Cucumis melo var. makuwa]TYK15371.1 kinesin-like protein KIN12B [Cucumis melo var. makuwa]
MKRSQETLSCELGDTHLTDPPPSSSPSPNGAGIKGGRPPRKPKSSPIPPRPPSSNPLKRKLIMETVIENFIPRLFDSGGKVVVHLRSLFKDEDEGDNIIQNLSQAFTFDVVADTEATQA